MGIKRKIKNPKYVKIFDFLFSDDVLVVGETFVTDKEKEKKEKRWNRKVVRKKSNEKWERKVKKEERKRWKRKKRGREKKNEKRVQKKVL